MKKFLVLVLIFQSAFGLSMYANSALSASDFNPEEPFYEIIPSIREKRTVTNNMKRLNEIENFYHEAPIIHKTYTLSELYFKKFKPLYHLNFRKMVKMQDPEIKDPEKQKTFLKKKRKFLVQYAYQKILESMVKNDVPMIKKIVEELYRLERYEPKLMAEVLNTTDIYNRNLIFHLHVLKDESFQKEFLNLLIGEQVNLNLYHKDFLGYNALHFTKDENLARYLLDHGIEVIETARGDDYPLILNFADDPTSRMVRTLNKANIIDFYEFVDAASVGVLRESLLYEKELEESAKKQFKDFSEEDVLDKKDNDLREKNARDFKTFMQATDPSNFMFSDTSESVVEHLFKDGISPNLKSATGYPVILHLIQLRRYDAVGLFLSHREFDVNILDPHGHNIAMYLLEYGKDDKNVHLLERMKRKGLDFKHKNNEGKAALDFVKHIRHLRWFKNKGFISTQDYKQIVLEKYPRSKEARKIREQEEAACRNQFAKKNPRQA